MSQESLSALLDGECSDQELDALLDAFDRSPELKASWGRLHAAREVRAGGHVRRIDICSAVMARLDQAPDAPRENVVELASRRKRFTAWRPMAGLAAAASVAAVAVTLGLNFGTVQTATGPAANDVAMAGGGGLQPVAFVQGQQGQSTAEIDDDLRNYMIEHSNTLADRGVGGALSYARFAARTADDAYLQPAALTAGGKP
jgi:negative regulator of sigma E activity